MTTATAPNQVDIGYAPHDIQRIAHCCPADELLFGGAAGGGKSAFLVNDNILSSFQPWPHPQSGILLRRTTPELQELEDYSRELLEGTGFGTYNQNDQRWVFTNGATLRFSHLQLLEDIYKHKSFEYDWIGIDEAGDFIPKQLEYMITRNRVRLGGWARMRYTTNPGGISHVYLKDRFVEPKRDGILLTRVRLVAYWNPDVLNPFDGKMGSFVRYPPDTYGIPDNTKYDVWLPPLSQETIAENERLIAAGEEPLPERSRCFIQSRVEHNPHIDRGYRLNLSELSDPDERARLFLGDWSVFDGQYFKEFSRATHVIDPISPPPYWRMWRSLDWGYDRPLVCLWHAQDPDTMQIVTYRELSQNHLKDSEAVELILSMTPATEQITGTWVDPSLFKGESNDNVNSIAEVYMQKGLRPLHPSQNARVSGWSVVRDAMGIDPRTGKPKWQVTSNCTNLIRNLPALVHDKNKPEDLDSDGPDDEADALRYGLVSSGTTVRRRTRPVKMGMWNVR